MIFLVEFLEDGTFAREPSRVTLELPDEAAVVEWLAERGRQAYVRRLFDPSGFLWVSRWRSRRGESHAH